MIYPTTCDCARCNIEIMNENAVFEVQLMCDLRYMDNGRVDKECDFTRRSVTTLDVFDVSNSGWGERQVALCVFCVFGGKPNCNGNDARTVNSWSIGGST